MKMENKAEYSIKNLNIKTHYCKQHFKEKFNMGIVSGGEDVTISKISQNKNLECIECRIIEEENHTFACIKINNEVFTVQRNLANRIHELKGELKYYKSIMDTQIAPLTKYLSENTKDKIKVWGKSTPLLAIEIIEELTEKLKKYDRDNN